MHRQSGPGHLLSRGSGLEARLVHVLLPFPFLVISTFILSISFHTSKQIISGIAISAVAINLVNDKKTRDKMHDSV